MAEPSGVSRRGLFRYFSGGESAPTDPVEKELQGIFADVERRKVLKLLALLTGGGAAGGAATVAGMYKYIAADMEQRTEDVEEMGEVLRGERPGAELEMFEKEWSYKEMIQLLSRLSKPRLGPDQVEELLGSFSYMIEVEDKFGSRFNTLPVLEKLDMKTEPHISFASSFGYGQINPQTARMIAVDRSAEFKRFGLLTDTDLEALEDPDIQERDIVEILQLRGDANIVLSFLAFYDVYNEYGRSSRGNINVMRSQDPRSFSLAVAGYSAKLDSPRNAKAQTQLNELMIMDEALRGTVQARLELQDKTLGSQRKLEVDGDLGGTTLETLKIISELIDVDLPVGLDVKIPKDPQEAGKVRHARMVAVDQWLANVRPKWKERVDVTRFKDEGGETRKLTEFVGNRYSTVVKTYLILKELAGEQEAERVRELFFAYADERDNTLLQFIDSPELLSEQFPGVNHEDFVKRVRRMIPGRVTFDDRYRGYVPLMYRAPDVYIEDPKNVVMRVLLAHELDEESRSRLGVAQK